MLEMQQGTFSSILNLQHEESSMKVICKKNDGLYSPIVLPYQIDCPITENNFILNNEYYTIDSERIGFCLTENRKYEVYGILFYLNQPRFLIQDDMGMPAFLPCELFEINEKSVCFDWEAAFYKTENGSLTWIGYPTIAQSYECFRDLFRRERNAISQFLQYKASVEQWYS